MNKLCSCIYTRKACANNTVLLAFFSVVTAGKLFICAKCNTFFTDFKIITHMVFLPINFDKAFILFNID